MVGLVDGEFVVGPAEGVAEGLTVGVVEGDLEGASVGTEVRKPPGTLHRLYVDVASGMRHCLYVWPGCTPQNAPGLQQGDWVAQPP